MKLLYIIIIGIIIYLIYKEFIKSNCKYKVGDIVVWKSLDLVFKIDSIKYNTYGIKVYSKDKSLYIDYYSFHLPVSDEYNIDFIRPATEEEKIWFLYCKHLDKFASKEKSLKEYTQQQEQKELIKFIEKDILR